VDYQVTKIDRDRADPYIFFSVSRDCMLPFQEGNWERKMTECMAECPFQLFVLFDAHFDYFDDVISFRDFVPGFITNQIGVWNSAAAVSLTTRVITFCIPRSSFDVEDSCQDGHRELTRRFINR
jgi:hypothetical protein